MTMTERPDITHAGSDCFASVQRAGTTYN